MRFQAILTLIVFILIPGSPSPHKINLISHYDCHPEVIKANGRYICTRNGQKVCLEGWSEPENDCLVPICSFENYKNEPGDHKYLGCAYGKCVSPNACACHVGWEGQRCDKCITSKSCHHGSCVENPFECVCHDHSKWTGEHCDIPVCKKGCKNGYCKQPGECICHRGWSGTHCDKCETHSLCEHGTCNSPGECNCLEGWLGVNCDCPKCKEGCNLLHGYCTKPGECLCTVGWQGENCDACIAHPECPNFPNNCKGPWDCICPSGINASICMAGERHLDRAISPHLLSSSCKQLNWVKFHDDEGWPSHHGVHPSTKTSFATTLSTKKVPEKQTSKPPSAASISTTPVPKSSPPLPTSKTTRKTSKVTSNLSSTIGGISTTSDTQTPMKKTSTSFPKDLVTSTTAPGSPDQFSITTLKTISSTQEVGKDDESVSQSAEPVSSKSPKQDQPTTKSTKNVDEVSRTSLKTTGKDLGETSTAKFAMTTIQSQDGEGTSYEKVSSTDLFPSTSTLHLEVLDVKATSSSISTTSTETKEEPFFSPIETTRDFKFYSTTLIDRDSMTSSTTKSESEFATKHHKSSESSSAPVEVGSSWPNASDHEKTRESGLTTTSIIKRGPFDEGSDVSKSKSGTSSSPTPTEVISSTGSSKTTGKLETGTTGRLNEADSSHRGISYTTTAFSKMYGPILTDPTPKEGSTTIQEQPGFSSPTISTGFTNKGDEALLGWESTVEQQGQSHSSGPTELTSELEAKMDSTTTSVESTKKQTIFIITEGVNLQTTTKSSTLIRHTTTDRASDKSSRITSEILTKSTSITQDLESDPNASSSYEQSPSSSITDVREGFKTSTTIKGPSGETASPNLTSTTEKFVSSKTDPGFTTDQTSSDRQQAELSTNYKTQSSSFSSTTLIPGFSTKADESKTSLKEQTSGNNEEQHSLTESTNTTVIGIGNQITTDKSATGNKKEEQQHTSSEATSTPKDQEITRKSTTAKYHHEETSPQTDPTTDLTSTDEQQQGSSTAFITESSSSSTTESNFDFTTTLKGVSAQSTKEEHSDKSSTTSKNEEEHTTKESTTVSVTEVSTITEDLGSTEMSTSMKVKVTTSSPTDHKITRKSTTSKSQYEQTSSQTDFTTDQTSTEEQQPEFSTDFKSSSSTIGLVTQITLKGQTGKKNEEQHTSTESTSVSVTEISTITEDLGSTETSTSMKVNATTSTPKDHEITRKSTTSKYQYQQTSSQTDFTTDQTSTEEQQPEFSTDFKSSSSTIGLVTQTTLKGQTGKKNEEQHTSTESTSVSVTEISTITEDLGSTEMSTSMKVKVTTSSPMDHKITRKSTTSKSQHEQTSPQTDSTTYQTSTGEQQPEFSTDFKSSSSTVKSFIDLSTSGKGNEEQHTTTENTSGIVTDTYTPTEDFGSTETSVKVIGQTSTSDGHENIRKSTTGKVQQEETSFQTDSTMDEQSTTNGYQSEFSTEESTTHSKTYTTHTPQDLTSTKTSSSSEFFTSSSMAENPGFTTDQTTTDGQQSEFSTIYTTKSRSSSTSKSKSDLSTNPETGLVTQTTLKGQTGKKNEEQHTSTESTSVIATEISTITEDSGSTQTSTSIKVNATSSTPKDHESTRESTTSKSQLEQTSPQTDFTTDQTSTGEQQSEFTTSYKTQSSTLLPIRSTVSSSISTNEGSKEETVFSMDHPTTSDLLTSSQNSESTKTPSRTKSTTLKSDETSPQIDLTSDQTSLGPQHSVPSFSTTNLIPTLSTSDGEILNIQSTLNKKEEQSSPGLITNSNSTTQLLANKEFSTRSTSFEEHKLFETSPTLKVVSESNLQTSDQTSGYPSTVHKTSSEVSSTVAKSSRDLESTEPIANTENRSRSTDKTDLGTSKFTSPTSSSPDISPKSGASTSSSGFSNPQGSPVQKGETTTIGGREYDGQKTPETSTYLVSDKTSELSTLPGLSTFGSNDLKSTRQKNEDDHSRSDQTSLSPASTIVPTSDFSEAENQSRSTIDINSKSRLSTFFGEESSLALQETHSSPSDFSNEPGKTKSDLESTNFKPHETSANMDGFMGQSTRVSSPKNYPNESDSSEEATNSKFVSTDQTFKDSSYTTPFKSLASTSLKIKTGSDLIAEIDSTKDIFEHPTTKSPFSLSSTFDEIHPGSSTKELGPLEAVVSTFDSSAKPSITNELSGFTTTLQPLPHSSSTLKGQMENLETTIMAKSPSSRDTNYSTTKLQPDSASNITLTSISSTTSLLSSESNVNRSSLTDFESSTTEKSNPNGTNLVENENSGSTVVVKISSSTVSSQDSDFEKGTGHSRSTLSSDSNVTSVIHHHHGDEVRPTMDTGLTSTPNTTSADITYINISTTVTIQETNTTAKKFSSPEENFPIIETLLPEVNYAEDLGFISGPTTLTNFTNSTNVTSYPTKYHRQSKKTTKRTENTKFRKTTAIQELHEFTKAITQNNSLNQDQVLQQSSNSSTSDGFSTTHFKENDPKSWTTMPQLNASSTQNVFEKSSMKPEATSEVSELQKSKDIQAATISETASSATKHSHSNDTNRIDDQSRPTSDNFRPIDSSTVSTGTKSNETVEFDSASSNIDNETTSNKYFQGSDLTTNKFEATSGSYHTDGNGMSKGNETFNKTTLDDMDSSSSGPIHGHQTTKMETGIEASTPGSLGNESSTAPPETSYTKIAEKPSPSDSSSYSISSSKSVVDHGVTSEIDYGQHQSTRNEHGQWHGGSTSNLKENGTEKTTETSTRGHKKDDSNLQFQSSLSQDKYSTSHPIPDTKENFTEFGSTHFHTDEKSTTSSNFHESTSDHKKDPSYPTQDLKENFTESNKFGSTHFHKDEKSTTSSNFQESTTDNPIKNTSSTTFSSTGDFSSIKSSTTSNDVRSSSSNTSHQQSSTDIEHPSSPTGSSTVSNISSSQTLSLGNGTTKGYSNDGQTTFHDFLTTTRNKTTESGQQTSYFYQSGENQTKSDEIPARSNPSFSNTTTGGFKIESTTTKDYQAYKTDFNSTGTSTSKFVHDVNHTSTSPEANLTNHSSTFKMFASTSSDINSTVRANTSLTPSTTESLPSSSSIPIKTSSESVYFPTGSKSSSGNQENHTNFQTLNSTILSGSQENTTKFWNSNSTTLSLSTTSSSSSDASSTPVLPKVTSTSQESVKTSLPTKQATTKTTTKTTETYFDWFKDQFDPIIMKNPFTEKSKTTKSIFDLDSFDFRMFDTTKKKSVATTAVNPINVLNPIYKPAVPPKTYLPQTVNWIYKK